MASCVTYDQSPQVVLLQRHSLPQVVLHPQLLDGGPSFMDSLPVWTTSNPFCIHFSDIWLANTFFEIPLKSLNITEAINPSP